LTINDRSILTAKIGAKSEALVFAFSELSRPGLFEDSLGRAVVPKELISYTAIVDVTTFYRDLLLIECANLLEQRAMYAYPNLARWAQSQNLINKDGFINSL
jgi:hypothetical protein